LGSRDSGGGLWGSFEPATLAALSGLDWKARYLVEGFLAGRHKSPYHGFSVEFSEYREYQPGDDLRHLDWQLFARSDRLYIKRYTQETNVRVYLVCDTSGSMAYRGESAWAGKLDVARLIAAALSWLMIHQNDAAGLLAYSGREGEPELIRPSQKPSQLGLILQRLEQLRATGTPSLAPLLRQAVRLFHRRSVVLIFSDLLEPSADVADSLRQLRFQGHEVLVFQVLDRDELEFPFSERAVFEDLESRVRRRVSPAEARSRYLERFEAFMEEHRQLLAALEIPHTIVRTDASPWDALGRFLLERSRML
jgi:uncharacterized protein (DUF58 family)